MNIIERIRYFFDSEFLNPHGLCLLWRPDILIVHVASDVLIGLAYYSIPFAIGYFLLKRRGLSFGWMGWLFVSFILLCGTTHFFSIWTLWNPHYGVEALLKAVTASVSVITALMLMPLTPQLLAIPSPSMLENQIRAKDEALRDREAAYLALQQKSDEMIALKEHDRRQQLLIDELNHRVKNTLASVQSIAQQTLRAAESKEQFAMTFEKRLMALSQTHNLLVEHHWSHVFFRELVDRLLAPYGKVYTVVGKDIELHPNYAVSIGMALHELATNAAKHGAWSAEYNGAVNLSVHVSENEICLGWDESGGPYVERPKKTSFGTRLLTRGLPNEVNGIARLEYRFTGLHYSLCFPPNERTGVVRENPANGGVVV